MQGLFAGCNFYLYFFPTNTRDELVSAITRNGGKIAATFNREVMGSNLARVTHFLTTEQKLLESSYQIKQAENMAIPVLAPQWLLESVAAQRLLPFGQFPCVVPKGPGGAKKPTVTFTKVRMLS
jgi:hypothetical protein